MTEEQAIKWLKDMLKHFDLPQEQYQTALEIAIKALEQESKPDIRDNRVRNELNRVKNELEPKTGHCKDCKYFEYNSVAKVDEIPLIVAHEICSRWGDGCKTKEDGYCFLFEQKQESEDK